MNKNLDPNVYSNQTQWVADPDDTEYGGKFVPITWKELAEQRAAEILRLQEFRLMVANLDRNENGRHEGDADVGDPTGVSQGNPRLKTGDILGYDIGGHPYIMPEHKDRHDPAAWRKRT